MKKIFSILLTILIILPNISHAAFGATWQATSTTQGWIFPNLINGTRPVLFSQSGFIGNATSTLTDLFYRKDTSCEYVLEGDSMTDNAAQPNDWTSVMEGYDHDFGKCLVVNKATTGDTIQNILSTYPSQIQPLKPVYGSDRRYFFLWAGTNDLNNGGDATSTYSYFKQTAQLAKGDGFKVIAVPIMIRQQFITTPSKEAARQQFNKMLLADQNTGLYDYIPRPDLAINNFNDATYFADSTHLTALGGQIVAQIFAATLHSQPWAITPERYATSSNYTVAWNPGGNSLFGTTSNQIKTNAIVTIAATSSDLVSNILDVFNTASTSVLKVNNAGLTIPTGLVMGTSTLTGKYVDIGLRSFAPTETTPSYALGVVNESTTGFAAMFDGGGATNQPARVLFRGPTNNNARPFSSACLQAAINLTSYATSYGQFGSATAAATCRTQPEITVTGGFVGISTSTPVVALDVVGAVRAQAEAANVNNITNDIEVRRTTNDSLLYEGFRTTPDSWIISATFNTNGAYKPLSFATSDTIRQTILANGVVGIATTTPSSTYQLAVAGTGGLYVGGQVYASSTVSFPNISAFATGDSAVCQRPGSGLITADSGVSSCTVSSIFVKDYEGKESYADAKRKIDLLNVVRFKYKDSGKEDIGLFAEEAAKIDPRYAQYETVEETIDGHVFHAGDPKGVNWTAIQADMIVVMQHDTSDRPLFSWTDIFIGLALGTAAYCFITKKK